MTPKRLALPVVTRTSAYRAYKLSVPPFVLFFPAVYRVMPRGLKIVFCCEFPLYWTHFPADGAVSGEARISEEDHGIEHDFNQVHKMPGAASYQHAAV